MTTPGLKTRILLALLVPLVIFAPITLVVVYRTLDRSIAVEADARGTAVAQQISAVIVDEVLTGEAYAAERDMADIVRAQPDVAYAFAVDAQGRVVAHTFSDGYPTDLLLAHRLDRSAGAALGVSLGGETAHDLAAPILGGAAGCVHVGVMTRGAREASGTMLLHLLLVGVGVVLVGVALSYGLSSQISRRLEGVATVAEAIGAGDLQARVSDPATDEIGRLASAFDRMAERLELARREREQTFARLAQAEKLAAIGQLAAGVAHEINNPLTGVRHCVEALECGDPDRAKRLEYYRLMTDGVARAQEVIRQLLEYSRQRPLELSAVDLRGLVPRVVKLFGPVFDRARVDPSLSLDAALPAVRADPHGVEQVLTNLFLNAVDAMPNGGTLSIAVERVGRDARVRVQDTGGGIARESLPRVFEPFFTTKPGAKGTGLGLSVSLGIVERHGGRIELASEPGQGATFDVLLPLCPEEAKREAAE